MDFSLSEIQTELSGLAEKLFREQATPQQLAKLEESGYRFDPNLWGLLGQMNLLGLCIPEANGGVGLGFADLCVVLAEAGRVTAPIPIVANEIALLSLHKSDPIAFSGLIRRCVDGTSFVSTAISTDSNVNTLKKEGNIVTGNIHGVPYADKAVGLILPVQETSNWAVYYIPGSASSLRTQRQATSTLEPTHCVCVDSSEAVRLGEAELLTWMQHRLCVAVCAFQTGILSEALKLTVRYVSEREQFGVKIGSFQAVSQRVADAYIDVSLFELITNSVATLLANGKPADLQVYAAKAWCGDAGHRVLASCQQVHGGIGLDKDYALWRYAVWAKQNEVLLGSSSECFYRIGELIAADPESVIRLDYERPS